MIPPRIKLDLKDKSETGPETAFCVITADPDPFLQVEDQLGDKGEIEVRPSGRVGPPERVSRFVVRLKSGAAHIQKTHRLIIRHSIAKTEPLIVPVSVTIGGEE